MSPSRDPLVALLEACARRERAAFERLYRETSAKLFGVAVRIVRREDLAEEVLQDCYLRIWNRAQDYRAALAAPMTWMTRIVRNRCLDQLRRPRVEIPDDDGAALEAAESAEPDPLAALERHAETGAVRRCLETLDAKQRQAIALAYYEALSHSELAARLREPLGTVKTWVRRGLLRLRACLEAG